MLLNTASEICPPPTSKKKNLVRIIELSLSISWWLFGIVATPPCWFYAGSVNGMRVVGFSWWEYLEKGSPSLKKLFTTFKGSACSWQQVCL